MSNLVRIGIFLSLADGAVSATGAGLGHGRRSRPRAPVSATGAGLGHARPEPLIAQLEGIAGRIDEHLQAPVAMDELSAGRGSQASR